MDNSALVKLRERMLGAVNKGNKIQHSIKVDFSHIDPEFVGTFVIHKPSQMERLEIGRITAFLKGGDDSVDTRTHNIATITATFEVLLDSKPDWFDVFDPRVEYEISEEVYAQYMNFLATFRNGAKGSEPTGDSENKPSEV